MIINTSDGRYVNSGTFVNSIDSRTKLACLVGFVLSVCLSDSWYLLAVSAFALILFIIASAIALSSVLKGLKVIVPVIIITLITNILFGTGAYSRIAFSSLKIIEITAASNIFVTVTRAGDIIYSIEKALSFLKVFKIPVEDIALSVSVAIRFIPLVASEAEKTVCAQKARGAYRSRSLSKRIKCAISVITPVFASSMRRADSLALAMDSRLYGFGKRSCIRVRSYRNIDYFVYAVLVLYIAIFVILRFFVCL